MPKPITATNEVYLPGVFGDVFDVIFAHPDVRRWRTIDTYPVVIVTGEIELTAAEGRRLAEYVSKGGTLLVAGDHLSGPGAGALNLPPTAAPEEVPQPLLDQLAEGGRLVIPVGPSHSQYLEIHERRGGKIQVRRVFPVRFVPMTGEAQKRP